MVDLDSTVTQVFGYANKFIADASHELRSPLTALRTPSEVALAHPQQADRPGVANGTLQDLDQLDDLVADLLALARTDATALPDGVPVDLTSLLTELVDGRSTMAITRAVDVDEHAVVQGRRAHLARLFTNLLDNAERYARDEIAVRLRVEPARVNIVDDGPDIPMEDRELVFERFTRLDSSRDRGAGGAGLGLALARGIATLHAGSLELADSGRGAHFVARFPIAVTP